MTDSSQASRAKRPLAGILAGLVGCMVLMIASPGHALVVSGFESGTLSGWYASAATLSGVTTNLSSLGGGIGDPTGGWISPDGGNLAYLMTQPVSPVSGKFSLLSEAFSVSAGDLLHFDLFFDTGEDAQSARVGTARLLAEGAGSDEIVPPIYSCDVDNLARFGADGWRHVSYQFASAGSYQLEFAISADQTGLPWPDMGKTSTAMGFNDIEVDSQPTPEPSSLALLGPALGIFALALRRRRR